MARSSPSFTNIEIENKITMTEMKVYSPSTLDEACRLLAERGTAMTVLAGGTDLMVLMNSGQLGAPEFLNIWGVEELRGVTDEGLALRIGALTTHTQLIQSSPVQLHAPLLVQAARTIGAAQTQNRGTIGGNIVSASPAGDTLPVLAAFDAELELGSIRGVRRVGFNDFYVGYRRTVLAPDELLVSILLPKQAAIERSRLYKVGTRAAQSISKIVMAARATVGDDGTIGSIAIALGSVAPTVMRARETEHLLSGAAITPELIELACRRLALEVKPISDIRSTERYRRMVSGNLIARFLRGE